jgi:hypothetical protein
LLWHRLPLFFTASAFNPEFLPHVPWLASGRKHMYADWFFNAA